MPPPKILVVTRHTPLPTDDGSGAYLTAVLSALNKAGYKVHLLWLQPHTEIQWKGIWQLPEDLFQIANYKLAGSIRIGRYHIFPGTYWYPLKARFLNRIKHVLKYFFLAPKNSSQRSAQIKSKPRGWMSGPDIVEYSLFEKQFARIQPHYVLINYAWLIPITQIHHKKLSSSVRICLAHDVMNERAKLVNDKSSALSEYEERNLLNQVQIVAAISPGDVETFNRMGLTSNVVHLPKPTTRNPLPQSHETRVLFVAGNNHLNLEGIQWLLKNIWPFFKKSNPSYILDICGKICEGIKNRPDGVKLHYNVPSLIPYYKSAQFVVVPLLSATGCNIKLIEAASFERAIISTTVALKGAPHFNSVVSIGDTPDSFISAMLQLAADPELRNKKAKMCADVISNHFTPQRAARPLLEAMRSHNGRLGLG